MARTCCSPSVANLSPVLPELLLAILHAPEAHGLEDAVFGFHRGAFQRHMPHLCQAGFLAEPEQLDKQFLQPLQAPAAELGQALDFIQMLKGNQKTLHRQIRSQFQRKRHFPYLQLIMRSATGVPSPGRSPPNRHQSNSARRGAARAGSWRR